MRIYVAAPWDDRHLANEAAIKVENAGHTITHKWWNVEKGALDDGYARYTDEQLQEFALMDIQGVDTADAVIVLNTRKSEGKAFEQGLAYTAAIRTIVVGEKRLSIFQYLPAFEFVSTVEEALHALDT